MGIHDQPSFFQKFKPAFPSTGNLFLPIDVGFMQCIFIVFIVIFLFVFSLDFVRGTVIRAKAPVPSLRRRRAGTPSISTSDPTVATSISAPIPNVATSTFAPILAVVTSAHPLFSLVDEDDKLSPH